MNEFTVQPGSRIGYARVSTHDQHPEAQKIRLEAAGCARVFQDRASGKLASRPDWDACLAYLRRGDTLICVRLDRIGRSVSNLITVVKNLAERGVDLVVLEQGLDTTTAAGRMMFHVLAAMAEFEHDLISERTKDGLAATIARGRNGGRKPKLKAYQVKYARGVISSKQMSVKAVAAELGVSRQTLYRSLERKPS